MRILEIGAATGRYSHYFAQQGYWVNAVELLEQNIEIFKTKTLSGENLTVTQVNANDLLDFSDNTYDITLLLGPMCHLFPRRKSCRLCQRRFGSQSGADYLQRVLYGRCICTSIWFRARRDI